MANAFVNTPAKRVQSIPTYERHILRRAYVHLLERIDDATASERELEWATIGQPGGIFDPSISSFLREAEHAWDDVTDSLSATIAAASGVPETNPLATMAYTLRDVLASEDGEDFARMIGRARRAIAETCIRPDMSVAEKDTFRLLRTTASRLDALDGLKLYHRIQPQVPAIHF